MPGWQDAVQETGAGTRILVEVAAGAREARFPDGFNPWRDGRIGLRVRAPAHEGRANEEAMRAVAAFFHHPAARVHIEAGRLDSRKSILVLGIAREAALRVLAPALERP